jgi:hypothetical protein
MILSLSSLIRFVPIVDGYSDLEKPYVDCCFKLVLIYLAILVYIGEYLRDLNIFPLFLRLDRFTYYWLDIYV